MNSNLDSAAIREILLTTEQLLEADRMYEALAALQSSYIEIKETGFDNWNGGTTLWTIYLNLDPQTYSQLSRKKEVFEKQISKRFNLTIEQYSSDNFTIKFVPKVVKKEITTTNGEIPKDKRKNIFDCFTMDNIHYAGALNDVEFLQRIFDLETLPSYDSRYSTAAGDIWQHTVNNDDYPLNWVFTDERFNLSSCDEEVFIKFISEALNPIVRPDRNETLSLVQHINDQLKSCGWELIEIEKIAGRPRFQGEKTATKNRSISRGKAVADSLDAGWMQKEIERLEYAVETDPILAIGTAKDLVETCCKTILKKREVEYPRSADIPTLTKLLTKELKLVANDVPDSARGAENIKLILRNLSNITKNIAELRGLYGTGHGRDGQHKGLEIRHARLAVGAAIIFIDFITETHNKRQLTQSTDKE
ncbi:Putative uncharacterized protein [Halomonas sp. R57-5]|uniref:abortive infection family protein n=1 Tax=Halomonas sp. R57-5 TaxID=1610576 RepID=UPI0005FC9B34|nr:abortive infection family protein [Halomonas sp. R57-5]CEP36847.1 Putative uncharacterized protein [Halomonas sp. R57-5]